MPSGPRIRGRSAAWAGPAGSANGLGLAAVSWLARDRPAGNLCLSPAGLALTLGLALNGAGGPTYVLLAEALGLKKHTLDTANESLAAWRASLLEAGAGLEISIASSLWTHTPSIVRDDFESRLARWHDAFASGLDFRESSSLAAINAWASKKSQGKIGQIVHSLDPAAKLLLLNVVHFRGKWSQAFNPEWTKDMPFQLNEGRFVSHPLMMASGEFPHFRTDEVEGIALPYGSGRWRMIILLPDRGGSLLSLLADLGPRLWSAWMRRLHTDKGTILLPRFHLETTLELGGAMTELGLGPAFDPAQADFQGMAEPASGLAIGRLLQNVWADVDEQGTEAAAATLMVQVVAWPPPRWQPFHMQVDRPFLFAIEDVQAGTLLFLGAVFDPDSHRQGTAPSRDGFIPPPGTPPEIWSTSTSA